MCRLFGFRSVIQSQVHRSLTNADNALSVQSAKHPHGWGVAYYRADVPHVIKSPVSAFDDHIFKRVSGVVASETVLAHVRKATVGDTNILNCHPFQFGRWCFAHNGQIEQIEAVRAELIEEVAPVLRRYIFGDTDSEVLFYLFLTNLSQRWDLEHRGAPVGEVVGALTQAVQLVLEVSGRAGAEGAKPSSLTVIVTDGHAMAGYRLGQTLYYSTHKSRCLDRDRCPFLAGECEAPTRTGHVNHLIISSEPLLGDNIWSEMVDGEAVAVDWRMHLHTTRDGALRPVVEKVRAVAP